MAISKRIKDLASLILNKEDYCTVEELASKLDVSQRTVYRELPDVQKMMDEYGVVLSTASKKGLRAEGRQQDLRKLRMKIEGTGDVYLVDSKKRMDHILLYLLYQNDWVKTEAIAIDHQASLTTIRGDLAKMQERLKSYDLRLVQQKGLGIRLNGIQMEKNHLMTDILLRQVDETELYRWLSGEYGGTDPFLQRMIEYGYDKTMFKAHRSLLEVFAGNDHTLQMLKTREYLEMVFLLSFLLHAHETGNPYTEYLGASLESEREQAIMRKVLRQLQDDFRFEFKDSELSYIQWVIGVSLGRSGASVTTIRNQSTNETILQFMEYVEDRMGLYLTRDTELREGLYAHMDKALLRIRSNMQISNPALAEIKRDYAELFRLVQDGVEKFFPKDNFPEDELGYLVLYFALTMDKMAKKIFRVLVVCSGGMGSSKMLAGAIEREIPEIRVEKTLSVIALGKERLEDYDLVLSTIPLYLDDNDYLRVSPMLHKNEIELIREKVRRHKHSQLKRIDEDQKNRYISSDIDIISVLNQVEEISAFGRELLRQLIIMKIGKYSGNWEQIPDLSTDDHITCIQDGHVQIRQVSKFKIPTTRTVYYEGIHDGLKEPVIFGHCYEHMDPQSGDKPVSGIIVLYPEEIGKSKKKALHFLIECMIEDLSVTDYFEKGDEDGIRQWMGLRLREYLESLLQGQAFRDS